MPSLSRLAALAVTTTNKVRLPLLLFRRARCLLSISSPFFLPPLLSGNSRRLLMMGLAQELGSQERPDCNAMREKNDKIFDINKNMQTKVQEGKGAQERYKELLGGGEEGGEWECEGEQKFDWEEEVGEKRKKDKGNSITGAPGN